MILRDGFWWPNGTENYRRRYLNRRRDGRVLVERLFSRHICVQAGGHVGTWPTWLAGEFGWVHTFEPDRLNLECLRKNTSPYPNIIVHSSALAAQAGRIGWRRSESNSGGHRVVPGGDAVETRTIDALQLEHCDAVFLDVEGSELAALRGAVDTLERCDPALMLEWNNKGEKVGLSTRAELGSWLKKQGYKQVAEVSYDKVFMRV